jgi:hypothetical protein
MKHRFKHICYNVNDLLIGCTTLKEFIKRADKQSKLHPENWDSETYKGDALEALVEVLINSSPIDKRINITNYSPWNTDTQGKDRGIDGTGLSHDEKPHTVQIKSRTNTTGYLEANNDKLSNFVAMSCTLYMGKEVDMTIFTTAEGVVNHTLEEMYSDKVRVIGYKEMAKLIDNNLAFWKTFYNEMLV